MDYHLVMVGSEVFADMLIVEKANALNPLESEMEPYHVFRMGTPVHLNKSYHISIFQKHSTNRELTPIVEEAQISKDKPPFLPELHTSTVLYVSTLKRL